MRRQRYRLDTNDWLSHYEYPTVKDMQSEYNLPMTGVVDNDTREAMTARRCGCAFRRNPGSVQAKLPTNRPKVFFQDFIKTDFTQDTFVKAVIEGMNYWSKVCNLTFERTLVQTQANIVVKTEVIDGPGETLAYAYFPSGNRLGLPLVFGEEEAWDKAWGIDLRSTACHEGGHNAGVDHDPTAKGVMAAFYNPKILVPTSVWEIKQMVDRYGGPLPQSVPAPTPLPPGQLEKLRILISGNNLKVEGYERV